MQVSALTRTAIVVVGIMCVLAFSFVPSFGDSEFQVNPTRMDPYKPFKFVVVWDGKPVAGLTKVSALRRTTTVVSNRRGTDSSAIHLSPGQTAYVPIVLERGRTHAGEFERWANKVASVQGDAAVSLKDFRKDIMIQLLNEAGQLVMAFKVYRCWPSEYVALGDLDARNDSAPATESLTLQCEGWERDTSITEPTELAK